MLQDYYASRVPEYDQIYSKPERQSDLRALERWIPTALEGKRILEVACGTGYWTQFIAPRAAHVLAIDAVKETLDVARTRVPPGKVRFVLGDAYALPKVEPVPEAGFAGFWISHVPRSRTRAFLRGLGAALMPGATVVLLDNRFVEGSSSPISEVDAEGDTYQRRPLRDGTTHRVLKNFPSEAEVRELLQGLGTDVEYRSWQYFWTLKYQVAAP